MQVSRIIERDLTALAEDYPLSTVIEVLAINSGCGLPVVDKEGRVVGFINEKDIIRAALPGHFEYLDDKFVLPDIEQLRGRLERIMSDPVSKHMLKDVIKFEETEDFLKVVIALTQKGVRAAPVVKDGYLVGVVKREDILNRFLMRQVETKADEPA